MLLDDLRHEFGGDEVVGDSFLAGHDDVDQHVVGAQSAAPGADDGAALADLAFDAVLFELLLEGRRHLFGARGDAACPLTDQHLDLIIFSGHKFYP